MLGWVRRELIEMGIPPLKRFGQHFLLSEAVRDQLVDQANITSADTVMEVGAGLGFVTTALASKAGRVMAIEKDRTLAKRLADKFSTNHSVEVIQGDALTIPIPAESKIVSSPPYNISSKLVLHIIGSRFRVASLLLQEDFVGRLTARSGSREYGRLTVTLQTRAEAEYVTHVPKSAFYPQPRVDSAVATIRPLQAAMIPKDGGIFSDLVRTLFTQRRRRAHSVIKRYLTTNYIKQKDEILSNAALNDKRVYELTPTEFVNLSNLIAGSVKPSQTKNA
jgi:16S rRNA (adenine1518-N6/adenine1519-N6)-dimethyltransferase